MATGRTERDITSDLRGALPPAKETHLGAITEPLEVGKLLRNIENYKGSEVVRLALRLSPLVFVRPGELRQAVWTEFDLDNCLWTIPAGRMKAKRPHVVPLSNQSISILNELKTLTGGDGLLFPSPRSRTRCLSDVAILAALQRMGYEKGEMTAHGFRALASTNLEQLGYDVRLIEIQLAHADQDQVRAAYKRETHLLKLVERKKMMQHWADYLDGLRSGATVLPFKKIGRPSRSDFLPAKSKAQSRQRHECPQEPDAGDGCYQSENGQFNLLVANITISNSREAQNAFLGNAVPPLLGRALGIAVAILLNRPHNDQTIT